LVSLGGKMLPGHGVSTKLAVLGCLLLAACATPEVASGIHDPYEVTNRKIHESNRNIDRKVLRPVAYAYGESVPEPVRIGVSNFADNLSLPGDVVNNILQFRLDDAIHNTVRFMVNTTIGLGGVLDPGTAIGLTARETDFGETLHVWGVGEGAYLELPSLGPSTQRDAVGRGVDIFLNPLSYIVRKPERYALPASGVAARLGDRYRFGGTLDSVLYDSADSYAQARLVYLENRRFQLSGDLEQDDEDLYDIYEETFE